MLEFKAHETDTEAFTYIEGECPLCEKENSLIITNIKKIRKTKFKIYFTCMCCDASFNNVTEESTDV
jgi:transcription elongation factor Elf1